MHRLATDIACCLSCDLISRAYSSVNTLMIVSIEELLQLQGERAAVLLRQLLYRSEVGKMNK